MKKVRLTVSQQQELIQTLSKWAASPRGRVALRRALEDAAKASVRLHKARRVDPRLLHEPFTV